MARKKKIQQELNMAEHSARLRAIPSPQWETIGRWVMTMVGAAVLMGLAYLVLSR